MQADDPFLTEFDLGSAIRVCTTGNWVALHDNLTLTEHTGAKARALQKRKGVIIYQLVTTPTTHEDVQYVNVRAASFSPSN